MYHGDSIRVNFLAPAQTITDVMDWFGLDFDVRKSGRPGETGDEAYEITVMVNEYAMFNWAMQYGHVIEVLSPESLRNRLAHTSSPYFAAIPFAASAYLSSSGWSLTLWNLCGCLAPVGRQN
jgi:hypothetical protein